jgi:hypothetical protein
MISNNSCKDMYVAYVFVYVCVYVCIYTYIYLHRQTYGVYPSTSVCVYMYMYKCRYMYIYIYVCIYTYTHVCLTAYWLKHTYIDLRCVSIDIHNIHVSAFLDQVFNQIHLCMYVRMYVCMYVSTSTTFMSAPLMTRSSSKFMYVCIHVCMYA